MKYQSITTVNTQNITSYGKERKMRWKEDRYGWPIETVKGRYVRNFIRTVIQNIRKLTG